MDTNSQFPGRYREARVIDGRGERGMNGKSYFVLNRRTPDDVKILINGQLGQ